MIFFLVSLTLSCQFQANFEFLVTILTKTFRFLFASYCCCCCRLAVSACNTSGTTHRMELPQRREQSKMSDGESFRTGCRVSTHLKLKKNLGEKARQKCMQCATKKRVNFCWILFDRSDDGDDDTNRLVGNNVCT